MGGRTQASSKVLVMVAETPGLTPRQVAEALGFDPASGLLSYLLKDKQIYSSGPRGWHRLYATKELAEQNHERIAAEAEATKRARKVRGWATAEVKRKAARAAAREAKKPEPTKPIGPTTFLPGVKITVAPTPRPRFAPEPGFVGVITNDWMQRRQGATSAGT
jgi:hypothetical protein